MKKVFKKKEIWFAALIVVLLGYSSVQGIMAYFTTYVEAKGGHIITLGTSTSVEEKVKDMTKYIVLSNTGESECYVRVKVFSGSQYTVDFSQGADENSNTWWKFNEEDGYWYYKNILQVGEETKELLAKIKVPEDLKESFDIVVIQECTPVLYDEAGNPYADWNRKADTRTDIGVANGEEDTGE